MIIHIINTYKELVGHYEHIITVVQAIVKVEKTMNIFLYDVLNITDFYKSVKCIDCVLELENFTVAAYNSPNHQNYISGIYWDNVPDVYLSKYLAFKNQQCIEINNDIILLSNYNNSLSGKILSGTQIDIIPHNPWNLKAILN